MNFDFDRFNVISKLWNTPRLLYTRAILATTTSLAPATHLSQHNESTTLSRPFPLTSLLIRRVSLFSWREHPRPFNHALPHEPHFLRRADAPHIQRVRGPHDAPEAEAARGRRVERVLQQQPNRIRTDEGALERGQHDDGRELERAVRGRPVRPANDARDAPRGDTRVAGPCFVDDGESVAAGSRLMTASTNWRTSASPVQEMGR